MSINLQQFKQFFEEDEINLLFISSISSSIDVFFLYLANYYGSKFNFKLSKDHLQMNEVSLFAEKYVFIYDLKSSKEIENIILKPEKKLIFCTYKLYKIYSKKYLSINSYNYKNDIKSLIFDELNIQNTTLVENIIDSPESVFSETSKALIFQKIKKAQNQKMHLDPILDIRKEINHLETTGANLIKRYHLIKKESELKKFNFLIY